MITSKRNVRSTPSTNGDFLEKNYWPENIENWHWSTLIFDQTSRYHLLFKRIVHWIMWIFVVQRFVPLEMDTVTRVQSWTSLFVSKIMLALGKVRIQLFSHKLWANSRADYALQPSYCNLSRRKKTIIQAC